MPTVTTFDALLSGYSWNGVGVAGRPAFVTYSFDATWSAIFSDAYSPAFLSSFQTFAPAEQDLARRALQAWGDISGLTFIEVPGGQGDIRFGVYDFRFGPESVASSLGFAYNPFVFDFEGGAWEEAFGGDVFIDVGDVTFDTLLHEIGHALGLKHPFEGEMRLESALDDLAHTVMTYNPVGGPAAGLGVLDVQAIQHLYGTQVQDGQQADAWSWDAAALQLTQSGGAGGDTLAGVAVADRISGGAGDDYVMARAGADRLDGDDGADTLAGGDGDDTLSGGAGRDILGGDDGDDSIAGGEGDDYLGGGSGVNRLAGGAGDDILAVEDGASLVDGGEGYDELWLLGPWSTASSLSYAGLTAQGGSHTGIEAVAMFGGQAGDTLVGGALPDALVGDAGPDSLVGGAADDELFGDDGPDTLSGGDGRDVFDGGADDDLILPGEGADDIWGGEGNDTVDFSAETGPVDITVNRPRLAGGASETMHEVENLVGTAFADNLLGDAGANQLFGGAGADTVRGGDGANYLRGDEGGDSLGGGADFDDINGNMGDDTAAGGAGDDWVVGGKDHDLLFGDAGADIVFGNLGSDTCDGGAGADTVRGGQQDDVLSGGGGDDWLSGDRESDTLSGGAGADIFHTFGEAGLDLVTDFSLADGDRVLLDPGTEFTVAQVGANTVISTVGGGRMVLAGVQLATLPPGWIFGA